MDDLKVRIKSLMQEIEYTHLKKNWVQQLISVGIEKEDAYKWVAEIGHVVDEYERSLRYLVEMFQENDVERIAVQLESWVAYTHDMTMWKLGDVTEQLKGHYEKYLPPEEDDEADEA